MRPPSQSPLGLPTAHCAKAEVLRTASGPSPTQSPLLLITSPLFLLASSVPSTVVSPCYLNMANMLPPLSQVLHSLSFTLGLGFCVKGFQAHTQI